MDHEISIQLYINRANMMRVVARAHAKMPRVRRPRIGPTFVLGARTSGTFGVWTSLNMPVPVGMGIPIIMLSLTPVTRSWRP